MLICGRGDGSLASCCEVDAVVFPDHLGLQDVSENFEQSVLWEQL